MRLVVLEAVLAERLATASRAEEGTVVLLGVLVLLARVEEVVVHELEEPPAEYGDYGGGRSQTRPKTRIGTGERGRDERGGEGRPRLT